MTLYSFLAVTSTTPGYGDTDVAGSVPAKPVSPHFSTPRTLLGPQMNKGVTMVQQSSVHRQSETSFPTTHYQTGSSYSDEVTQSKSSSSASHPSHGTSSALTETDESGSTESSSLGKNVTPTPMQQPPPHNDITTAPMQPAPLHEASPEAGQSSPPQRDVTHGSQHSKFKVTASCSFKIRFGAG